MKEILGETSKASKPGTAPRESAGLIVGPLGCAELSGGSAGLVRLSACCLLSEPIKAFVPVASRDGRQLQGEGPELAKVTSDPMGHTS